MRAVVWIISCGRAGRQGDKRRSRFFISLDDDLMRIFGSDQIEGDGHPQDA